MLLTLDWRLIYIKEVCVMCCVSSPHLVAVLLECVPECDCRPPFVDLVPKATLYGIFAG